jgi:RNA polymerase sigma-70 factor (ECF subfamily)
MTADHQTRKRFESIWDEHRLQILAYCLRRTTSADAEDACAETFLVAWRRLEEVPPPPQTILYLYGVAGRVLSNHFRSVRRRSRLDAKLSNLGIAPPEDPLHVVVRSAEDEIVVTAVARLGARDREIVMLDAWEELSREEIAEVLGMTRDAVDQRIHRSYKRLSRALAPVLDHPPLDSPPVAEGGGA